MFLILPIDVSHNSACRATDDRADPRIAPSQSADRGAAHGTDRGAAQCALLGGSHISAAHAEPDDRNGNQISKFLHELLLLYRGRDRLRLITSF